MGVAVLAFTLASQAGRMPDQPMMHRYCACPSIACVGWVLRSAFLACNVPVCDARPFVGSTFLACEV
jgi:hypothetical protein